MGDATDWNIPKQQPPPKTAGIVLSAVGALLMFVSAFSHAWMSSRTGDDVGISPLSIKAGGETTSNFAAVAKIQDSLAHYDGDIPDSDKPSGGWPVAGLVAFICQLLGGVGAAVTAVLAWRGLRPATPIAATTVALLGSLVGLIAGCVFVMSKPTFLGPLRIGMGFWAFSLGSVGALIGAQFLAKHIQPIDPDLV